MTKPISSFPEKERVQVALRRVNAEKDGLGKLSAENFLRRINVKFTKRSSKKKEEDK